MLSITFWLVLQMAQCNDLAQSPRRLLRQNPPVHQILLSIAQETAEEDHNVFLGRIIMANNETLIACSWEGLVYVYRLEEGEYVRKQTFPYNAESIALSSTDNTIVVGYSSNWPTDGETVIIDFSDDPPQWDVSWIRTGFLFQHAKAVAIDSDTMVTMGKDTLNGPVFVYVRNPSNATQWILQQEITILGTRSFGCIPETKSIALSGDVLAFACIVYDGTPGNVFVYRRNGTDWVLEAWLDADVIDSERLQTFGISLALDQDLLAIGGSALYIYKYNSSAWVLQQTIDSRPQGIAIKGSRLLFGSDGVHFYEFDSLSGEWVWKAQFQEPDTAFFSFKSNFGSDVALSSSHAFVSTDSSLNGYSYGGIFVYDINSFYPTPNPTNHPTSSPTEHPSQSPTLSLSPTSSPSTSAPTIDIPTPTPTGSPINSSINVVQPSNQQPSISLLQLDQNIIPFVMLGIFVLMGITTYLISVRCGPHGSKRKSMAILTWFATAFDVWSDIFFVVELYQIIQTVHWSFLIEFGAAIVCVGVASFCSFIQLSRFLRESVKDPEMRKWLEQHRGFLAALSLVCLSNLNALRIIHSHAFNHSIFQAPLSEQLVIRLEMGGFYSTILEDIPQLIIQIVVAVRLQGLTSVTIVASVATVLQILVSGLRFTFNKILVELDDALTKQDKDEKLDSK